MKNYLLLMRGGDAGMAELSEKESAAHMDKWNTYMGDLAQAGFLSGGLPLAQTGKLLSADSITDKVVLSEKGEAVGGYLLIKAESYDHAIELSKSCPIFEYKGTIEIREAVDM